MNENHDSVNGNHEATGPTTRVVHSSPVWLPRTQTWMHTQARCLPSWIENHVACESTQNLDQFRMPHIHALAQGPRLYLLWDKLMRGLGLRRHLGHLPQVLRQVGADLLHSHFGHIGWGDRKAARRQNIPHVVTYYGQDLSYLPLAQPSWQQRYRELFQDVSRVLCEGPHMAQRVIELGCPEDKVQVHHLGVDLDAFRFEPRTWDQNQPLRILLAGSFTEKKGFPDAIRAVDRLRRMRPDLQLEITILGDASSQERDQQEKRRILAAIEETGLQEQTTLLGYQPWDRLLEEAYRHHIFLSPSVHARDGDTEGGAPVTILEMAATGMPVVSTDHCDIPAVILRDSGGLLAPEGDIDGLAQHLLHLADEPTCWQKMGKVAREHVQQNYDMHRQGAALADIYRSVLELESSG